jgi:2,5-diketo-D-gluconate reductase B
MQFVDMDGTQCPALGFGTWQLIGNECTQAVQTALSVGYRHIDTAQIYNNEAEVGLAIASSGVARDKIFLTTKVWMDNFKKADVLTSVDASLKKLKTDYVDLLLIHWPSAKVPLQETLGAMKQLQDAKKVKQIGVSNFPVALMKKALEELGFPIVNNQVEYHLMLSQKPVLDYARQHNMTVTAYSPLARGKLDSNPTVQQIAGKYNKHAGQVALRWLIDQPNVAAIPKAGSKNHIEQNFEIFDFQLDTDDTKTLDALNGDGRLINPDWAPKWDKAA